MCWNILYSQFNNVIALLHGLSLVLTIPDSSINILKSWTSKIICRMLVLKLRQRYPASGNCQTLYIREHWSAESIVSPLLCARAADTYNESDPSAYPIGWLGRGSDYRLHPGARSSRARSLNRIECRPDGVCEEIVARDESIRNERTIFVYGNHYRWMSGNVSCDEAACSVCSCGIFCAIIRFRLLIKCVPKLKLYTTIRHFKG